MVNSGRFEIGHKETKEVKEKRVKSLVNSWKIRNDHHGMYDSKFYNCWRSMITRCRGTAGKDSVKKYKNKGITVCEDWQTFKGFYNDMFDSYTEGLTIDRIDNGLGYFKENCRWANATQQANNKTNNVKIFYDGKSLTLRQWSELLKCNINSIRLRYYRQYKKGKITLDQLFAMYLKH